MPKPWDDAEERFAPGTVVHGTVVRIAPFGAFVSIAPGIDGMVHISEIVNHYVKKVEEVLSVGQEVDAVVLGCDAQQAYKPEHQGTASSKRTVMKPKSLRMQSRLRTDHGV